MKKILCSLIAFLIIQSMAEAGWFDFAGLGNDSSAVSESSSSSAGNHFSQSFYDVKDQMLQHIYYDHRQTLYCDAAFDAHKNIKTPQGFKLPDLRRVDFYVYDIDTEELARKAKRMEWEHIVPAQNFGKTFPQWAEGHRNCVSHKGKHFKGRSCAMQESEAFRYMYTDMYNLYPSIGAVNYLRSNFNFTQFSSSEKLKNIFGSCNLKISHNKVEPRDEVKGFIARTYLYMEQTYHRYKIGEPMKSVLTAWNKQYPVTEWECRRAYRIEQLQGNANQIVKSACKAQNLYRDAK